MKKMSSSSSSSGSGAGQLMRPLTQQLTMLLLIHRQKSKA
jgi:hypothetical protein